MRHTAHVKLKQFKLTFNLLPSPSDDPAVRLKDSDTNDVAPEDPSKALNDDDCVLYALRVNQLQAKVQKFLRGDKAKPRIRSEPAKNVEPTPDPPNIDSYLHNIVRVIFENAIAATAADTNNRNNIFRIYVDEMYKEFFFHHNYTKSLEMPQTLRSLYPTLAIIEHSCDPNCFVMWDKQSATKVSQILMCIF